MRAGGEHMNFLYSVRRWFFRNGILFGQHHSAISKIINDSSAEDSSVVLSTESGSRREAANLKSVEHTTEA